MQFRRNLIAGKSREVFDIIDKLLQKTPENRLGYHGGAEEILAHPWFESLNIGKLERGEIQAPIIPNS